MTATVLISNVGPDAVKVEVQDRIKGKFAQAKEFNLESGQCATVEVYDTRSFQTMKLKPKK